jgi:lysophospholipase L1-like esterase
MLRKLTSSFLFSMLIVVGVVCQPQSSDQKLRPLNMLVLGDSIMWGQGLKPEHKSWRQVKLWLERTTGRAVLERVEAHSGALIEPGPTDDQLSASNPEVNVARPTVHDQVDAALKYYQDPAAVDVILLSACGNDVGVENLLNAAKVEEIDDMAAKKCRTPLERLLRRVAASFRSSTIIVVGYYPFFSEKTRNDFVLKGLTKRFVKVVPGAPRLSSKETLVRLTENSRDWYVASNKTLAEVVQKINGEIGSSPSRITFAKIDFPPEYSFAAHDTRLWGFNRSPFRMLMLFLSFGKLVLPANDEVRRQRTAGCNEVFKRPPSETANQKSEREKRRMFCRYASLGHPNRLGATLYADAVIARMPATLGRISSR